MATIHPYLGVTKKEGYNSRRQQKYEKETQRRFILNAHRKHDKDVIKWLENNKPYATAIKKLVREQIAQEKKKK